MSITAVSPAPPDTAAIHRLPHLLHLRAAPWVSAPYEDARGFAELALTLATENKRTLDLGTGTGLLAICLAKLGWPVIASDLSGAALRLAQRNARRHGVTIECRRSDLLTNLEGPFDLIVFNPPSNAVRDFFLLNVVRNILRRIPWLRRRVARSVPGLIQRFHQQLILRLIDQARSRLSPDGAIFLHLYESQIASLTESLPADVSFEVLRCPALAPYHTLGLLLRFRNRESIARAA